MEINYNNKKFKVISNSNNGEVSANLIFHYFQKEQIVTCNYSDATILEGHILGIVNLDGSIDIHYHQINIKNELKAGVCFSTPKLLPNGKIQIHEKWQWTSGDNSKGFTILEEL